MVRIPVETVAGKIGIAALPDPRVVTKDGVEIAEGMRLYQAYSPERLVEYEVIHDIAFRNEGQGHWEIVVLGAKLPIISLQARNFVADAARWEEFWQRRHQGQGNPELAWPKEPAGNGKKRRRRRKRRTAGGQEVQRS